MDELLKKLGDTRHILREAQIKMKKYSDNLLQDSRYLGGVVDMIEEAIENTKEGEKHE